MSQPRNKASHATAVVWLVIVVKCQNQISAEADESDMRLTCAPVLRHRVTCHRSGKNLLDLFTMSGVDAGTCDRVAGGFLFLLRPRRCV